MLWPDNTLYTWAKSLHAGQVGIAPAEGQYGYVADPFNPAALQKIMDLKIRSANKGLIVLAAEPSDLKFICPLLTGANKEATKTHWWGATPPTTIILPAREDLPELLTGGRTTIAVRRPFVPYMQSYLRAWKSFSGHGILVSTSCNISGQPPAISQATLPPETPEVLALTLNYPLSGTPSRIFDPQTQSFLR